jgi:hypothetical protein
MRSIGLYHYRVIGLALLQVEDDKVIVVPRIEQPRTKIASFLERHRDAILEAKKKQESVLLPGCTVSIVSGSRKPTSVPKSAIFIDHQLDCAQRSR